MKCPICFHGLSSCHKQYDYSGGEIFFKCCNCHDFWCSLSKENYIYNFGSTALKGGHFSRGTSIEHKYMDYMQEIYNCFYSLRPEHIPEDYQSAIKKIIILSNFI